jgi:hypothetical protein
VEDDEGEEVARMQHYLTNPINRSLPSNALAVLAMVEQCNTSGRLLRS